MRVLTSSLFHNNLFNFEHSYLLFLSHHFKPTPSTGSLDLYLHIYLLTCSLSVRHLGWFPAAPGNPVNLSRDLLFEAIIVSL